LSEVVDPMTGKPERIRQRRKVSQVINAAVVALASSDAKAAEVSGLDRDAIRGERGGLKKLAGMTVEEYQERVGARVDELLDLAINQVKEQIPQMRGSSSAIALGILMDKKKQLLEMSQPTTQTQHNTVVINAASKEELMAMLTGKPVEKKVHGIPS